MIKKITLSDKTDLSVHNNAFRFLQRCYLLRNATCRADRIRLQTTLHLPSVSTEYAFVCDEHERVFGERPKGMEAEVARLRQKVAYCLTVHAFQQEGIPISKSDAETILARYNQLNSTKEESMSTKKAVQKTASKKVTKVAKVEKPTASAKPAAVKEPKAPAVPRQEAAEKTPRRSIRFAAVEILAKSKGSRTDADMLVDLRAEFPGKVPQNPFHMCRRLLAQGAYGFGPTKVEEKEEPKATVAEKAPATAAKKPIKKIQKVTKTEAFETL